MELSTVLTYTGILIAAFGATQEFVRSKLKLSSIIWKILFFTTLVLLFLLTLNVINTFIENNILKYFNSLIMSGNKTNSINTQKLKSILELINIILLFLNFLFLFLIVKTSKLRKNNQNKFLDLLCEFKDSENIHNYYKLIKDNLTNIFDLMNENYKFTKYTAKRDLQYEFKWIFNTNYFLVTSRIKEIFNYTILDKEMVKNLAKYNELLGHEIIFQFLKYENIHMKDAMNKFFEYFFREVLKNPNSYTYNTYFGIKNKNVEILLEEIYKNDLGKTIETHIYTVIKDLILENDFILAQSYNKDNLNTKFEHIENLIRIMVIVINKDSTCSNDIQMLIIKNLKNTTLTKDTIAYELINSMLLYMKFTNQRNNAKYAKEYFNLYENLKNKVDKSIMIDLFMYYIEFMIERDNIEMIKNNIKNLKDYLKSYTLVENEIFIIIYKALQKYISLHYAEEKNDLDKIYLEIDNLNKFLYERIEDSRNMENIEKLV